MTVKIKQCLGNLFKRTKKFEGKSVSPKAIKILETRMELPVPTHLKVILIPEEYRVDTLRLKGKIRCTCGCAEMKLKTWPKVNRGEIKVQEYHGSLALNVMGECTICGKIHELFDASKHGYDGLVCHEYAAVSNEELCDCCCDNCGKDAFIVQVDIDTEEPEQFVEEVVEDASEEFQPEDYVDAFGGIRMIMRCKNCGKSIQMEMETA